MSNLLQLPTTWAARKTWVGVYEMLTQVWGFPSLRETLEHDTGYEQPDIIEESYMFTAGGKQYKLSDGETRIASWYRSRYTGLLRYWETHGYMPYGAHKTWESGSTDWKFCIGTILPYKNLGDALAEPLDGALTCSWRNDEPFVSGECLNCGRHIFTRTNGEIDSFELMCLLELNKEKGYNYEWRRPTMS